MSLVTLVLLGVYVLFDYNKTEGAGWLLFAAALTLAYGANQDLRKMLGRGKD